MVTRFSIPSRLAKYVPTCSPDHQGRVELEPVRPERGILEEFLKLPDVPLGPAIGEIRHHVRDDLVPRVLGEVERLADGSDRMAAIGIARNVLRVLASAVTRSG